MNPVIVRIKGGLGNQMFQYAAGRALSKRLKTTLLLDITEYESGNQRNFELMNFNIQCEIADKKILKKYPIIEKKITNKFIPNSFSKKYYFEKKFEFDPFWQKIKSPKYIEGYFQSEKYFSEINQVIRTDFCKKLNENLNLIKEEMEKSNSVMIHIRRGDYLSNHKSNEIHGLCSVDYYYRSIIELEKINKNMKYFIFSDDMDWVKKNLKIDGNIKYIENIENPTDNVILMSNCKYHVIANSSFSWWGAWLSKANNIIAPNSWFKTKNISSEDILPTQWVKL